MKTLFVALATLANLSAFAAAPKDKISCTATGTVDQITAIELIYSDLEGGVNATITRRDGSRQQDNSVGSLDRNEKKIFVTSTVKDSMGSKETYLQMNASGEYQLVQYFIANCANQEESYYCYGSVPAPVVAHEKANCIRD